MTTEIGQEIKKVRIEKAMTLKSVSELTGYSISFISQLERGKSSATLESIKKIAIALKVSPSRFFEQYEEAEGMEVSAVTKKRSRNNGVFYEDLGANLLKRDFVPMLVTLQPGETDGSPIVHSGQEFIYVLEGNLTVQLDGRYHELLPGEKIMYISARPHYWFNYGAKETRFLCISSDI
ncbi:XRE family transcriptional regulator [Sporosarcina gallistercoris]|uniref:helix-turn-helix domain-containing protein n=1 Tax=Sporosarcina gallistercoris TaxID=2762245 RepID=UPI003D2CD26E